MHSIKVQLAAALCSCLFFVARAQADECTPAERANILARATAAAPSATVRCSLTLTSGDWVTKRLRFRGPESSGVTLDCGAAQIAPTFMEPAEGSDRIPAAISVESVESSEPGCTGTDCCVKDSDGDCTYLPPSDITIKNCSIKGPVRVSGMGKDYKASSRRANHVAKARREAPSDITFEHVIIEPVPNELDMFYVASGAKRVRLLNSTVRGKVKNLAIYLDAESTQNTLYGNVIQVSSENRELIAVDGSSHNVIANNSFAAQGGANLYGAAIYLYRNCGEKGHHPAHHAEQQLHREQRLSHGAQPRAPAWRAL